MKKTPKGWRGWQFRMPFKTLLIMKLIVVLMLGGLLQVTAKGFSQITLSHKNATLEKVFKEIRKQSGYNILCDAAILREPYQVNISVIDASVETVLNKCFEGRPLTYIISNKTIVVKRKLFEAPAAAPEPDIIVSGKVTNDKQEPLKGVSVALKNSIIGTSTDDNGAFNLNIGNKSGTLIFSYVGYKERQVNVTASTQLNIVLQPENDSLDQIVVIGYGTQRKRDVNAAITSVKPEQLDKTSQTSVDQMLQGQAAGVTTFNSTQPGGGVSVLIRGATSTGAGNGPLVVIDGFPVIYDPVEPGSGNKYYFGGRGALNDINPNDIASIEILKDASATAIYGARGSNGVILITTKRAKLGSSVEYTFNASVQDIAKRPELLNAKEFLVEQNRYLYELYLQTYGLPPYGTNEPASAPPFVPRNSQATIDAAGVGTDWYDQITQKGFIQQHNLTISRGTDNVKSLFSFNYFGQDGVVKGTGLDRFSLRYNLDQKITKWWDYGASITASLTKSKNSQLGNGRDADAGIIESALNYNPLIKPERDALTGKWIEDPNQPLLGHPLSYLDIKDDTKLRRFLGSVFTNIYLSKDIWVRLNLGADIRNSIRQGYFPRTSRYGSQVNGEAIVNHAERNDYVSDITFNINKSFADVHKIQGVAGYSYQHYTGNGSGTRAQNFATDALGYDRLEAGAQRPDVNSYRDRHILASYFSRVQYSYNDKYILTLSARVDGSDRFGANNRYAFFPSVAFAWRLIDEPFLLNNNYVSDLKLRVSAGQMGNENIANDAASEYYGFNGRNYYFNGNLSPGVNLTKIGNPNLKWETTTEYNLGVDFGFLKNRITGSVDVYYKSITDLLSSRQLPQSSVVGSIPWNVGSTSGRGLEFTLNTINIVKPFRWNSILTFTSYRDRWKERDPKVMLQPYQGAEDPLTAIFSLIPDGIKQPGEHTPAMPSLLPGQQKFEDINGLDADGKLTGKPDGKINQADAVYRGTWAPKFSMGFNNSFEYKGFDLNVFLYASVGGLRFANTRMEHSVYGSYGTQRFKDNFNFFKEVQNRWTSTNTNTSMPSGEVNSYTGYGGSSPYYEKNTYLRLKTVTLGYNFSNGIFKNPWIKTSRLFIGGQNLFTITNYSGLDPEAENDRAFYPQQRTLFVGLNVKF
jgi:TonB-linked SusC/RagA family outer membrane protein